MKTTLLSILLVVLFTVSAPGQEVPEPFFYSKAGAFLFGESGSLVHQVGPKFDAMVKGAESDKEFTAIALSAGLTEGYYYIGLCHARPGKHGDVLKPFRDMPLSLTIDGSQIIVRNDRYYKRRSENGVRIEILMYGISVDLFNELLSGRQIFAEVGKFDHLASAENLKAFQYLRDALKREDAGKLDPLPPNEVAKPIRGFDHWDGYFVQWWRRRLPKS